MDLLRGNLYSVGGGAPSISMKTAQQSMKLKTNHLDPPRSLHTVQPREPEH